MIFSQGLLYWQNSQAGKQLGQKKGMSCIYSFLMIKMDVQLAKYLIVLQLSKMQLQLSYLICQKSYCNFPVNANLCCGTTLLFLFLLMWWWMALSGLKIVTSFHIQLGMYVVCLLLKIFNFIKRDLQRSSGPIELIQTYYIFHH